MKKAKFLKRSKVVALSLVAALTITSANGYGGGVYKAEAATTPTDTVNLDNGLVVHYAFDDSLENSAPGKSGSTTMKEGGTEAYVEGLDGKAFDFSANAGKEGTAASNLVKIDTLPTKTSFSLNYWVKGDGGLTEVGFDGRCQFYQFGMLGNRFARAAMSSDGTDASASRKGDREAVATETSDAAKWKMVTYTVSDSGQLKVYVNGKEQTLNPNFIPEGNPPVTYGTTGIGAGDESFFAYKLDGESSYKNMFSDVNYPGWTDAGYLGGGLWWGTNFSGQMDEFRMYDRALNEEEIKTLAARGIGLTPVDEVKEVKGVYQIPKKMVPTDGKVDLKLVFQEPRIVDVDGATLTELTMDDITFSGDNVDNTGKISGMDDEKVHEVTATYGTFELKLKVQAITKVDCTKLSVEKDGAEITELSLKKKGADVTVTAVGSATDPTTDLIEATATGCTATAGEETKDGNTTSVIYTIVPTAVTGSVEFTCGDQTATVTTVQEGTYKENGVLDLDFESDYTAGDETYKEDNIDFTLSGGTEVVTNPEDGSDKVLKTTTGYLDSVEAILKNADFSNGVSVSMKIRPDTQGSDWDYVYSLGQLKDEKKGVEKTCYVDGTIGFIARAGGDSDTKYVAKFPGGAWVTGNPVGGTATNNPYNYFTMAANCGKWYTLTYTYDSDAFCIYLNGIPTCKWALSDGEKSIVSEILEKLNEGSVFSLGCGVDRNLEKTPAYYDDVKVYDSALSAEEVAYRTALENAVECTSDLYENNAAKQAIQKAVEDAKKAIPDGAVVTAADFTEQKDALQSAVNTNKASLVKKTFRITATATDSKFNYNNTETAFSSVDYGKDVTFQVKPADGYTVSVKIDGVDKTNVSEEYKISNVKDNHTVEVTTKAIDYPLITYIDGERTEDTFTVEDPKENASGNILLPDLEGKYGWFTSPTDKTEANKITSFAPATYMTDFGITVYAYTPYTVSSDTGVTAGALEGGTVDTLPDTTKSYFKGDKVQIITTPAEGKAPAAKVETAGGTAIETAVVVTDDGKQAVEFEMPAANVTIKEISFTGISTEKLAALLDEETTLYESDNATETEGLTKEYTDATWTAYTTAYEAAKAVLDAGVDGKTQADIDAVMTDLKEAKEALVHTCAVQMPTTLSMEKGEEREAIEATVITNGEDKTIKWSSSDDATVKVNAKTGQLTALKSGTATITATAADDSTATCTVTVAVSVTAIKLSSSEILVGAKQTIKKSFLPDNATTSNLTWSSSDTSVATVNENGVVTGKSAGKVTIKAVSGDVEGSCTLKVIDSLDCKNSYQAVFAPGQEVGNDGVYMTFKAKTYGSLNWESPKLLVYSGETPTVAGNYVVRADKYVDRPEGVAELPVEEIGTYYPWDLWYAEAKEGVDCAVSAERVATGIKVRMFVGKAAGQVVIPVSGDGPFYVALTGGFCEMTNIKVVPRQEYREPLPYTPVAPVYPGSQTTPKPAITPGPVIDVPIAPADIKEDQTLTGTAWWDGKTVGQDYAFTGTDTSMVLYVGASKLNNGYGAFNIELFSDGKFLTTGSDKNAWYAEGAAGGDLYVAPEAERISTLDPNHVYRITITRKGNDITVNYYDATAQKEYYEVTAKDINFSDNVSVHVIAQVGSFKVGQEVTVDPNATAAPSQKPEETVAPSQKPEETVAPSQKPQETAAPSQKPQETAAPSQKPQETTEPGEEPEKTTVKPGKQVTVSGTNYQVKKGSEVAYKSKKKASASVSVPATVKIKGKTYRVTSVAANAFKNNKKVKKITIGKNITAIGKNAFSNCKKLKTIVIKSKKLKASAISKNAFKGISKKTVIKVPKSKVKKYKKLFRKKGLSKKVKVKAL